MTAAVVSEIATAGRDGRGASHRTGRLECRLAARAPQAPSIAAPHLHPRSRLRRRLAAAAERLRQPRHLLRWPRWLQWLGPLQKWRAGQGRAGPPGVHLKEETRVRDREEWI